jgi:hypothetical protein
MCNRYRESYLESPYDDLFESIKISESMTGTKKNNREFGLDRAILLTENFKTLFLSYLLYLYNSHHL